MVGVLERHVRARMVGPPDGAAVPICQVHDVAEIDREVRDALSEASEAD